MNQEQQEEQIGRGLALEWHLNQKQALAVDPEALMPVKAMNILLASMAIEQMKQQIQMLEFRVKEFEANDMRDDHSDAIDAAHPLTTGRFDLDLTAREMVAKRRSKGALIDLVRWLLTRLDEKSPAGGA